MTKLESIRKDIRHQDFRLRFLTKEEIFAEREIDSLENSLQDIEQKFIEASNQLKSIKIKENNPEHLRLKNSIEHYRKKFNENKRKLKSMIDSYLKNHS